MLLPTELHLTFTLPHLWVPTVHILWSLLWRTDLFFNEINLVFCIPNDGRLSSLVDATLLNKLLPELPDSSSLSELSSESEVTMEDLVLLVKTKSSPAPFTLGNILPLCFSVLMITLREYSGPLIGVIWNILDFASSLCKPVDDFRSRVVPHGSWFLEDPHLLAGEGRICRAVEAGSGAVMGVIWGSFETLEAVIGCILEGSSTCSMDIKSDFPKCTRTVNDTTYNITCTT